MPQPNEGPIPPLLLTVDQVSKALGLGRTKIYELIASEQLPIIRFGRAVRVSPASLQRWLEQREHQHEQG